MVVFFFKRFFLISKASSLIRRLSIVSTVGIGVSLAALIVVMSVMTALHDKNREKIFGVEPHLFIEMHGMNDPHLLELQPLSLKLQSESNARVQGVSRQDVIIKTLDGHFLGAVAKGFPRAGLKKTIQDMSQRTLGEKVLPYQSLESEVLPGEVYIGIDVALILGLYEGDQVDILAPESFLLPLGEPPILERVTIKKLFSSNVGDVDSQSLFYVEGDTLNRFKKTSSRQAQLEVWLPQAFDSTAVKQNLLSLPGIKVSTWQERNSSLFLSLRLEKLMMGVFLSMAALIAAFSVVSIIVLLISQKQSEIGILQTLGMPSSRVLVLFQRLGWVLGMAGVALGVLIGSGVSLGLEINPVNIFPADIYYDTALPARWDFWFTAFVLSGASVFCWALSHFGSLAVLKFSPIESIKRKN